MRRGGRGKWKGPQQRSEDERPKGLRGRDIGLYYRNKQINNKNKSEIRLEVPETVVAALHENIRAIESIALKENIYLEPVKTFEFVKPISYGADFIPIKADETEKQSHHVTNIIPKDNDVIFVSKAELNDIGNKPIVSKFKIVDDEIDDIILVKVEDDNMSEPMVISDDCTDSAFLNLNSEIMQDNVVFKHEATEKELLNVDMAVDMAGDINMDVKPNKPKMEHNEPEKITVSSTNEVLFHADIDVKATILELEPDTPVLEIEKNSEIKPDTDKKTIKSEIKPDTDAKAIKSEIKPDTDAKAIKSEIIPDTDAKAIKSEIKPDTDAKAIKSEMKCDIEVVASSSSQADTTLMDGDDVILVKSEHKGNEAVNSSSIYAASTSHQDQSITNTYKYGYEDIITGSFEEKLNDSLAKGININIKSGTINELSEALLQEYNEMVVTPNYQEMKKFRQILPAFQKDEALLDVINNNQVVVISGETGCGKSTQVPQIILDDAIKHNRGANVKILVTEPRRIAASSLAMRVAKERAEYMGNSVGYSVRLERVECRARGSIMFCTTGVLLVELEVNQSLSNYSHIVIDEVHERDCQVDIAMCMLRQVLKKRKDLKLILMSATIDAERICAYYDNCPMFHIKGLAYPVRDVYLEEILHMTHYQLPPVEQPKRQLKHWSNHKRGGNKAAALAMEKEIQYRAEIGPWLESIKKTLDPDVYRTLQDNRIEQIDVHLIFQLLLCISRSDPGAILVFLPGISDITKLIKVLVESRQFPESHFDIFPLHSKLPTLTQHRIFERPVAGVRKIIVATNIAETSITVDDIVYVVDCAKVKYKGLNIQDHVATLQTEWAAQTNLRQRRGRAGRCQAGICYHLVTSYRASTLAERMLPELQRDDLLEPVLQMKRLRLGYAEQALGMMPAVPHVITIRNAVRHLQQCGALDEKETLTPLGWHLARLPVHPAAGKLLLLGALFGCLERAASVAAVWGFKDPFNLVIGKEKEVEEAKKNLALGEPSDHIAMSEALIQFENCRSQSERYHFTREYFLSMSTLSLLSEMKKQFGENLKQMGFLNSGKVKSVWENRNADNLALFKAIVAASLYPNIGTVAWRNLNSNKKLAFMRVRTPEDPRVSVHPSSVMFSRPGHKYGGRALPLCANPGANWLVYWLKQRSSELYLIDVTLVYTLPLLFFGELKVTQAEKLDECIIDIKTIKVRCKKETTQLLFQLRSLLDQVLASKIMAKDGKRSTIFEEHVLNGVKKLITAEDAQVEYLDDDYQSDSYDYDGRN